MPRLEEVVIYIQGLWLLVVGREEGFGYLDLSSRGFWRSWWALFYCIPTSLLSYAAVKSGIAAMQDPSVIIGGDFYLKLAIVDLSGTLAGTLALFAIARFGGFGQHAMAIVIVLNWLAVPLQWVFSIDSLVQLYVPGSESFAGMIDVIYLLLSATLAYRLINRIVGGQALAASASILTLFIVPLGVQMQMLAMFGLLPR